MDDSTRKRIGECVLKNMKLTKSQYEELKALCEDLDLEPVTDWSEVEEEFK